MERMSGHGGGGMNDKITNRWGQARESRLEGRHVWVYRADSWTASYSHHPQVVAHKGRLFATWSQGNVHEDCPGQRMVCATSDDAGETWTAARVIIPSFPGEVADSCVTSLGLVPVGESLLAFYADYEFTSQGLYKYAEFGALSHGLPGLQCVRNVHSGIMRSTDDGATWQGPVAVIPDVIGNLSPVRLSSGRFIFPAFTMFPYTDDPSAVSGWKVAPLPGLPEGYYDRAGAHRPIASSWKTLGICEGSVYEPPGNPLRMMLRTNKGRLAVSESRDDGTSWSEPELTEFTDCGCRFQFGRLPDGRYFALSCPNPGGAEALLRRTPLVLATSEDGDVFDRHYILGNEPDQPLRYPGAFKHGRYGYPYAHITGEHLHVINSSGKEDIEFHTYDLRSLD